MGSVLKKWFLLKRIVFGVIYRILNKVNGGRCVRSWNVVVIFN